MQIDGSVVVVTGASTGIGRAVAQRLATRGCRLVLASRRTDRLEATASALKAAGAELAVLPTDIGIREDVERLAEFA
jgi:short-subunit dehydrogenase